MVPVGGGTGECLKIVQIENGSFGDLVNVLLEMTQGFAVPVGKVILLPSASHAVSVGSAEYAKDFVRAAQTLRRTFAGGGGYGPPRRYLLTWWHLWPACYQSTHRNGAVDCIYFQHKK